MTRNRKIYRAAYLLAAFTLGVSLLSGFQKLLHPADFTLAVYRFHLLPGVLVNAAALYVSWLELVCGACLLFIPRYRAAALWIVLALLLAFTGAIIINLLRGSAFSCGCFGNSPLAKPMDWLNVARNIGLIALAMLALAASKRSS